MVVGNVIYLKVPSNTSPPLPLVVNPIEEEKLHAEPFVRPYAVKPDPL
jgi:hypothetical protein